jgi:carboxyl-terminal processing protease
MSSGRQKTRRKKLVYAGLACLLPLIFAAGIWTGVRIDVASNSTDNVSQASATEFELVKQAWNITEDNYVDRTAVQPQRLAYATIAGMINSLGDTGHSTFLTPAEAKLENSFVQGQFEGVGIEVQEKNGNVVVVAPLEGSPAQKAGIRSGDIILKVDGQPVNNVADAVQRILGPVGTSVTLTIQTSSGDIKDVTITRVKIEVESVSWIRLPDTNIVHLRLSSFAKGTSTQLDDALTTINKQKTDGIILDLRDNPGGYLNEAMAVASCFLEKGNVLLVKDAKGNITAVPVIPTPVFTDSPLVVLVNQGTASAAEIVAGALRDNGRAKLVGEKTFGTGTVLEQFSLADGSAINLAIEEWLTPSGKTIWHVGLTPDYVVPLSAGVIPSFPNSEHDLTLDQLKASGDSQLLRALNLVEAASR